jgi:hypothetical protein
MEISDVELKKSLIDIKLDLNSEKYFRDSCLLLNALVIEKTRGNIIAILIIL